MTGGSVVVLGAANVDLVLRVATIPAPGETVAAHGSEVHAGGKGLNQAVAAARSGARTTFLAALGDDDQGRFLRAEAEAAGVHVDAVRVVAERTGRAHVIVDDRGENSIVVDGVANTTMRTLTTTERQRIADADVVLLQLECPVESAWECADMAHESGGSVILNAAPAGELPAALLAAVDVLIVNEGEATAVLRHLGALRPEMRVDEQACTLTRLVPAVVVTRGAAGLVLATSDGVVSMAALRVPVVDTTGAGDTFCGALAAEIARGVSLEDACRYATAAAALAVGLRGAAASIPTREAVEAQLTVHA